MVYGDRLISCPEAGHGLHHGRAAVLQRVVAKLRDAAASQLGVTQAAVTWMLNGTEALPTRVLLRAVDIVLDEFQLVPSGESRPINRAEP